VKDILQFLTPYRGVRYHLKEWSQIQNAKPADYQVLFNLRHSSARNVIERAFGVIKRRFQILKYGCEHPISTQIKLFPALACLSNYIDRLEKDDDHILDQYVDEEPNNPEENASANRIEASSAATKEAEKWRDTIAKQLWQDYLNYKETQRQQNTRE
jgi:DDE superfamily endonuclease